MKLKENMINSFMKIPQEYFDGILNEIEFKKSYIKLWKEYRDTDAHYEVNNDYNSILDRIFTALDCYCSDIDLRDDNDFNECQLRAEVENIFKDLTPTQKHELGVSDNILTKYTESPTVNN